MKAFLPLHVHFHLGKNPALSTSLLISEQNLRGVGNTCFLFSLRTTILGSAF